MFKAAIRWSAAAVILVHNHPSGDPEPSADDLRITARLAEAGRVLGIEVLDHVVVGDGRHVSLRERGHLTGLLPRDSQRRLVNGARDAVGVEVLDDLPRGIRDDCGLCPVAHALEDIAAACGYAFVNADVSRAEFYPGPDDVAYQPEQVARVAAAWGGTAWEAGSAEAEVYFPEDIAAFIALFDRGAFPDLEEGDV